MRLWRTCLTVAATACALVGGAGCFHDTLEPEELAWNPYRGGETLVFTSDRGGRDTMLVRAVIRGIYPGGVGTPLLAPEELMVAGTFTDPNHDRSLDGVLLEIRARTLREPAEINFRFAAENARFHADPYRLDSVAALPVTRLRTGAGVLDDVRVVVTNTFRYADRSNAVRSISWSRRYGYVAFEKMDGERWTLEQMYRVPVEPYNSRVGP